VTGECGDDHGVEAGIGGLTGAHVGVGVDPEDRQVIAVLVAEKPKEPPSRRGGSLV